MHNIVKIEEMYTRKIYVSGKISIDITSVGLAPARPNYMYCYMYKYVLVQAMLSPIHIRDLQ